MTSPQDCDEQGNSGLAFPQLLSCKMNFVRANVNFYAYSEGSSRVEDEFVADACTLPTLGNYLVSFSGERPQLLD